eukprot:4857616-Amphidinium_carterae.2
MVIKDITQPWGSRTFLLGCRPWFKNYTVSIFKETLALTRCFSKQQHVRLLFVALKRLRFGSALIAHSAFAHRFSQSADMTGGISEKTTSSNQAVSHS